MTHTEALVEFEVVGNPEQQGSKTRTRWGGMRDANADLEPWRQATIHAARQARGDVVILGPVWVEVLFVFARPKAHFGTGRNAGVLKPSAPSWHAQVPDLDKLQRALGDSLTMAGVFRDDSQIARWDPRKVWANGPVTPGMLVRVGSLS